MQMAWMIDSPRPRCPPRTMGYSTRKCRGGHAGRISFFDSLSRRSSSLLRHGTRQRRFDGGPPGIPVQYPYPNGRPAQEKWSLRSMLSKRLLLLLLSSAIWGPSLSFIHGSDVLSPPRRPSDELHLISQGPPRRPRKAAGALSTCPAGKEKPRCRPQLNWH